MGRLLKPGVFEPNAVGAAAKPAQRSHKASMGSIHWSEMDPVHSQSSFSRNDSFMSPSCINPPKSVVSARAPAAAQPETRVAVKQRASSSKRIVEDWLKTIPGKRSEQEANERLCSRKQSEHKQLALRSSTRQSPVKARQNLPGSNPAHSSIGSSKAEASTGVSSHKLKPIESTSSRSTRRNSILVGNCVPNKPSAIPEAAHLKSTHDSKHWGQIRLQRKKASGTNPPLDNRKTTQAASTAIAPTKVKPFVLRSAALHERAVQKQKEQQIAMELADKKNRHFKARTCHQYPRKEKITREKNITIGVAPLLQSERRAQHWANVIKPRQEHKESVKMKLIKEKKKTEEMFMARILQISRQALVHQARPMPDFSKVFKPDLSLAARPTRPCPPRLTCVPQAA